MTYSYNKLPQFEQLLFKIKTKNFSIQTQYKFLKINKIVKEETDLFDEQMRYLICNYAERDENGNPILENNSIKIKQEYVEECFEKIKEINNMTIQFPDIYFSLDELEPLELTLEELELLEPMIK